MMKTATLTVQLPKEDLESAERYANEHRITLAELVAQQLRRLRSTKEAEDNNAPRQGTEGLGAILGRWSDGDDFADEVERIVANRTGSRLVPDFEA